MTAQDILTALSITVILAGALRWYINNQNKPLDQKIDDLCQVIEDVRAETKTNGGSSMRDEIKFIKKEQEEAKEIRKYQTEKIDHLYDLFVDYISKSK